MKDFRNIEYFKVFVYSNIFWFCWKLLVRFEIGLFWYILVFGKIGIYWNSK